MKIVTRLYQGNKRGRIIGERFFSKGGVILWLKRHYL